MQHPTPDARRFILVRDDGDDVAGWHVHGRCEVDDPDAPADATVAQLRDFYGGERWTRMVWEYDEDPT
ncbi:hypothetical protein J2S54_000021 [Streptomyces sp. DSM 42143]|uniref:hypothetical protein n=1 Tax=Streptomyces sp. DSM 42143 TaxID=2817711 RepID=UPI00278ACFB3|nr:hypothetical protein [Streptomyces sp. DSM 42143]MDQ0383201.1 hypothetical protein [Streptomyces sp. DSM 42143]